MLISISPASLRMTVLAFDLLIGHRWAEAGQQAAGIQAGDTDLIEAAPDRIDSAGKNRFLPFTPTEREGRVVSDPGR